MHGTHTTLCGLEVAIILKRCLIVRMALMDHFHVRIKSVVKRKLIFFIKQG